MATSLPYRCTALRSNPPALGSVKNQRTYQLYTSRFGEPLPFIHRQLFDAHSSALVCVLKRLLTLAIQIRFNTTEENYSYPHPLKNNDQFLSISHSEHLCPATNNIKLVQGLFDGWVVMW